MVQGEVPPRFANGVIDTYCPDLHFTFEANSWEEAMAIYHLRQGWEPIDPTGTQRHALRAMLFITQVAVVNAGGAGMTHNKRIWTLPTSGEESFF